jgi:hypothetical protein
MTSRKEYHASRDASKVPSKCIYFIVFIDGERAISAAFCLHFLMIYLHPQASTKDFQENNPRRIGHFTQHSCYSLPSLWILQWNRLLKLINRGFNDYKIIFIYYFNTLSTIVTYELFYLLFTNWNPYNQGLKIWYSWVGVSMKKS